MQMCWVVSLDMASKVSSCGWTRFFLRDGSIFGDCEPDKNWVIVDEWNVDLERLKNKNVILNWLFHENSPYWLAASSHVTIYNQ